jgi:hypothetical protein
MLPIEWELKALVERDAVLRVVVHIGGMADGTPNWPPRHQSWYITPENWIQ